MFKTSEEALNAKIAQAAWNINDLINNCGWTREAAIEATRKSSTFGPKAWQQVIEKIG